MLAPTSTRNGACWIARGLIGTRSRSAALDFLGERRRLLDVARLRHLPEDDLDVAGAAAEHRQRFGLALGHALRLVAVLLEAQIEHLGAGRRRANRRVGVEADEEVRLVVVGERRALVEVDGGIAVARQDHAHAQPRFERGLQPPRDAERDVLFERAAGPVRAVFGAAVAGVDDDRADAAGRARDRGAAAGQSARRATGGGSGAGAGAVVCAITSMTMRPAPRSPGRSDVPERAEPRTEVDDDARAVAGPES